MGKVLAIIFVCVFSWYAFPLLAKGIWISPTLYPNDWWGQDVYNYDPQIAQDGSGWFSFDLREGPGSGQTTASVFQSL